MITADTITDGQLREVMAFASRDEMEQDIGDYANLDELTRCALAGDLIAKRRCSEILNARNGASK